MKAKLSSSQLSNNKNFIGTCFLAGNIWNRLVRIMQYEPLEVNLQDLTMKLYFAVNNLGRLIVLFDICVHLLEQ